MYVDGARVPSTTVKQLKSIHVLELRELSPLLYHSSQDLLQRNGISYYPPGNIFQLLETVHIVCDIKIIFTALVLL